MPARLAVDAGCILSATIGGRGAKRVFRELTSTEFATTPFTLQEVADMIPRLAERLGVGKDELYLALRPLKDGRNLWEWLQQVDATIPRGCGSLGRVSILRAV